MLLMLNFSTTTLFNINEFILDMLFPFFINHISKDSLFIHLASKAGKFLDTTAKVVAISTGSTILYNSWVRLSSSSESDENKNKKNKMKINKIKITKVESCIILTWCSIFTRRSLF
nr:hypothetical protein [Lactarius zonarius]